MPARSRLPETAFAIWGAVFVVSGALKVMKPAVLAEEILAHGLIPASWAGGLAVVLPFLELFAGLALIVCQWRAGAKLVLFGLLAVFLVVNARAAILGLELDCGCFGSAFTATPKVMTLVDSLLLASGFCLEAGERAGRHGNAGISKH